MFILKAMIMSTNTQTGTIAATRAGISIVMSILKAMTMSTNTTGTIAAT